MQKKNIILAILVLLFVSGCNDLFSFNTISAIEDVSATYELFDPNDGKANILSTQAYRGSMLVLGQRRAKPQTMELFVVDNGGVTKFAMGSGVTKQGIVINQAEADGDIFLFGKAEGKDFPPRATAVMTLQNWKIIEEEIDLAEGFVIVLRNRASVVKLNLVDQEGNVLATFEDGGQHRIQNCEFTSYTGS